ncbi:hypothetical protein MHK_004031 [Candidatus Magnetomorum sp. HK-1]|nr:hypothetical protein MHK_004031 [Candidatus Magnetomorum sp. HK-1]
MYEENITTKKIMIPYTNELLQLEKEMQSFVDKKIIKKYGPNAEKHSRLYINELKSDKKKIQTKLNNESGKKKTDNKKYQSKSSENNVDINEKKSKETQTELTVNQSKNQTDERS